MEYVIDNPVIGAVALYLVLINVLAFVMYGVDKWAAQSRRRRTSEKALWIVALLGGSVGALAGMVTFRHKTRKVSFQFVLALIVLVQVALLYVIGEQFISL